MRAEIIPAIFAKDRQQALERIQIVKGLTRWVQIDVLDDTLIKNHSWHNEKEWNRWNPALSVELHLMVNNPEQYIRAWRKTKTFKRALWHFEAPIDHAKLIQLCRKMKLQVGLAISPQTPVAALVPFLRHIDSVLLLGYEPGWSGQKLLPSTLIKISQIKKIASKVIIAWDGGITAKNLQGLVKRGIKRACITSAIFKQRDPRLALKTLKQKIG